MRDGNDAGEAAGVASPRYPPGATAALLDTDRVTAPTRAALRARLSKPPVTEPVFLAEPEFHLLRAVTDRLLGQDGAVDVAGAIDGRLAANEGDGWRFDAMPPDRDALRLGLAGIEETAAALCGERFLDLDGGARDRVLAAVQAGEPPGETWRRLPAKRFFEDLLAVAAETFYAHPLAQDEIGYVGFADARGWHAIGLDERDGHEPMPVPP